MRLPSTYQIPAQSPLECPSIRTASAFALVLGHPDEVVTAEGAADEVVADGVSAEVRELSRKQLQLR